MYLPPHSRVDDLDSVEAFMRRFDFAAMVGRYEGHREHPWSPDLLKPESYEKLVGAVVGFEMTVLRWEAQFKLGQNRSEEDRARAAAALEGEGPAAADLAGFMKQYAQPQRK